MADESSNNAAVEQPIVVNAQYIKDLSFKAPAAPGVFAKMQDEAPDISVNINVSANPIQDKTFEVVLEIRAECKITGEIAFILELEYA
ncbi:MAG: protein-export chaperone SecB, partial [Rhodospirillales bacterium]|nr:protein-export chaperone SecB [Rhodospirillales bacterium]